MGPYILSGLVVGSIYAISALGLVLTYKSSRVFNFAHGAMAYAIAVFYYWLTRQQGWSIPVAAPVTLLVFAPLLGLVLYALLFRSLTHLTPTVRLVSTVGLWVALPAVVRIVFPVVRTNIQDPQGLVENPVDPKFVKVLGTWMDANQFAVIVVAFAIVVVTSLMLRFTPWGLATRATVDHPVNASIAGVNTEGVTALSWMFGALLAGLAGVLLAPFVGLLESQFTLLLVFSFAAVVIGRMTSLPLTFAGALLVGLLQQCWVKIQPESGILAKGVSTSIPFLVMLVFLIIYSFSKTGLRREAFARDQRRGGLHGDAPPLPVTHGWKRAAGPLAAAVGLAIVPILFDGRTVFGATFDSFWMTVFNQGLALAIIFLSYTLVTGEGGMISLSQITFAGIGAFAAARLAAEAGFPMWLAVLVGACIAIPFGLLVALPSLRIGDIYLAMLTIGFAIVIETVIWTRDEFDNNGQGVISSPPFGLSTFGGESKVLGIQLNDRIWLYIVLAVLFGILSLLIVNLKRATTGLVFASIRSSETASATSGISIVRAKLVIFAVSAFIAGLGGAFYSTTIGNVTAFQFTVIIGIVWLAIVVTWGVRSVVGALLAGIIFAIAPSKLSVILILSVVILAGGLIAQVISTKRHRTPLGVLVIAAAVIGTVAASIWMWDNVSTVDAVNTILVIISLAFGIAVGLKFYKAESLPRPAAVGLGLVAVVAGVALASQFVSGGIAIDELTAKEIPTMMFGLGAIVLAKEPRGVVYDIVNRQRLRQMHDAERRDEEVELSHQLQEATVGS